MINYITSFYKNLFGRPEVSTISLVDDDFKTIPGETVNKLTAEFSMEEIKKVVFEMAHNKSPGPNGFNAEFYHVFWDLIKADLKRMFDDFHSGRLDISRLNYGIITLVPKSKDAN